MQKRWQLRPEPKPEELAELTDYPELVQRLLFYRGLATKGAAEKFLQPDYERDLADPFLLKDMTRAAKRILEAIKRSEKIVIFGDYDADGVPGTAMLSIFFAQIGFTNFDVYIPDRHQEDYGLNEKAVREIAAGGAGLIITIDCGITDVTETKLANDLGLAVIITDHHLTPDQLPPADAILNPKQAGDQSPEKMLCGTGVAFKLIQALAAVGQFNLPAGWDKWLLDLVAIATITDMVPLTGENRILTYFGLKVLRQTRRPGLLALFQKARLKRAEITEDDVGFTIGAYLNAASRMSHASEAYNLLIASEPLVAGQIAGRLDGQVKERRKLVDKLLKEIGDELAAKELPPLIALGKNSWSPAVLGYTASRVAENYGRPVCLWGQNGAAAVKGSCRSDGSINLVELFKAAGGDDLFSDFGGHAMAAGFTCQSGQESELAARLAAAHASLPKTEVVKDLLIDRTLVLDDVNWQTWRLVEPLAPFGMDNPKPVFLLSRLAIVTVKTFGNGGIHLELGFQKSNGETVSAIGFFAVSLAGLSADGLVGHRFTEVTLKPGRVVDLVATLERSTFKTTPELRLRIVDLRPAS